MSEELDFAAIQDLVEAYIEAGSGTQAPRELFAERGALIVQLRNQTTLLTTHLTLAEALDIALLKIGRAVNYENWLKLNPTMPAGSFGINLVANLPALVMIIWRGKIVVVWPKSALSAPSATEPRRIPHP